jgi:hypothetical protein
VGAVQLRGGDVNQPLGEKVLASNGDVVRLTRTLDEIGNAFPRRIDADPEKVERGLAQLVLTLIELLRELMERQALRRMEQGTLSDDEIERLGQTFMLLSDRMEQLKVSFGLEDVELNLNLGPLGKLL